MSLADWPVDPSCKPLLGKNILLTGATGGLGKCVANTLWLQGASLAVVGRNAGALDELCSALMCRKAETQEIHAIVADLGDLEAARQIIAAARNRWARTDALINNAAMLGPIGPAWENDWHQWQRTIQVNLLAPVALCNLSVQWMKECGGGNIINISGGGASSPRPRFSAYATAKAGLVRFSEILAQEVTACNIRVNCVAPGAMNTPMLDAVLSADPESAGNEYERALEQQRTGGTPPQKAADLVVFLASSDSHGITGKLISAVWDPWRSLTDHVKDLQDSDIYTLRRITPGERGVDTHNWSWTA